MVFQDTSVTPECLQDTDKIMQVSKYSLIKWIALFNKEGIAEYQSIHLIYTAPELSGIWRISTDNQNMLNQNPIS